MTRLDRGGDGGRLRRPSIHTNDTIDTNEKSRRVQLVSLVSPFNVVGEVLVQDNDVMREGPLESGRWNDIITLQGKSHSVPEDSSRSNTLVSNEACWAIRRLDCEGLLQVARVSVPSDKHQTTHRDSESLVGKNRTLCLKRQA